MHDALFYVFSAAALIFALLVIANPFSRNAVTSAMFLVLTIGSIAGLFVLLEAYFLAAVQVLVYAGAVMVLFLFVIMLLDLKAEERRGFKGWTRKVSFAIAALSVAVLLYFMFRSFHQSALHRSDGTIEGATAPLGQLLFTQYLLPFEIVSVLLLVAMIGVILLSKRDVQ
jgi:NADH-quinone oxidoreductase subunit J